MGIGGVCGSLCQIERYHMNDWECPHCGQGYIAVGNHEDDSGEHTCDECGGDGKCHECRGTGTIDCGIEAASLHETMDGYEELKAV